MNGQILSCLFSLVSNQDLSIRPASPGAPNTLRLLGCHERRAASMRSLFDPCGCPRNRASSIALYKRNNYTKGLRCDDEEIIKEKKELTIMNIVSI
jgi:hypothetical protein